MSIWLVTSGFLLLRNAIIGKLMSSMTVVCMGICFFYLIIRPVFLLPTESDLKTLATKLHNLPGFPDTGVTYLYRLDTLAIHFYCDPGIFNDDNYKGFSKFRVGDFNIQMLISSLKSNNPGKVGFVILEKIGLKANELDNISEEALVGA